MNKTKSIIFILVATALHVVLDGLLTARYIGCNGRIGCMGLWDKICEYILGFPLRLISWMWQTPGQPATEGTLDVMLLNSFLAASIICAVVNIFLKKVKKTMSR